MKTDQVASYSNSNHGSTLVFFFSNTRCQRIPPVICLSLRVADIKIMESDFT